MTHKLMELVDLRAWAATSKEFDLRFWAAKNECGTTLCLAGKAAVAAGYQMIWPEQKRNSLCQALRCIHPDIGIPREIAEAGREVLGLNESEGQQLFTPNLEVSAVEASGKNQVDTTELDEKMSLDFLDLLIERAQTGKGHLDEEDVHDWHQQWVGEHYDELAETGVDD